MSTRDRVRTHLCILAAYVAVALAFAWPLPLHLATHLTGSPEGDTGTYVWNQWVFRHELVDHHSLPYFTDTLFGPRSTANLSLHNYTPFQDLLAVPLIPLLGVVATFNVIYLLMTVLTAYVTFLLARRVTGRTVEAWLAGLLFAWSPIMMARGTAHFSLVAAAPLALFLLLLLRPAHQYGIRDALAMGATIWWAASTDVYYAVYCILIAAVVASARLITIERIPRLDRPRAIRTVLDVLLVSLTVFVITLAVSGGWELTVLGMPLRMRTLYNPMLALTCVGLARAAWHYRVSIQQAISGAQVLAVARLATAAGLFSALLLSPVLYAVTLRVVEGDFDVPRIFWRSSPAGVDALALLLPNPSHPLAPARIAQWLSSRPEGFAENVASLPWVLLLTIGVAAWAGWRAPRRWVGLAIVFGLLSLGPFITVAGLSTQIPGPWALLRYVPVVGLARTPARFSIVLSLALVVMFAAALTWAGSRFPAQRRRMLVLVTVLALFELFPAPRPLYSAAIPRIYRHVAAAPDGAALLELPFGIRDGTSSIGNFTARSQFFQTAHGKTLMGGYLSRIARRRTSDLRGTPVLNALAVLSENRPLPPELERALLDEGEGFLKEKNVGFVVIDCARASGSLHDIAIRALKLELVESDGMFELYRARSTLAQRR